jgi:hypothetical protein
MKIELDKLATASREELLSVIAEFVQLQAEVEQLQTEVEELKRIKARSMTYFSNYDGKLTKIIQCEYLKHESEPIPSWLEKFNARDTFSRNDFFASRIVYYPGSRFDGQPVKLFSSTHSAHCFVYADYRITQAELEAELEENGFRGYHTLARLQLAENDLVPRGWRPHIHAEIEALRRDQSFINLPSFDNYPPFGFLEILERDHDYDDSHGARRLAILFLCADGIAAYDAMFCQGDSARLPYAVIVHDHGFGGHYDRFGQGGLLERIAISCNVIPEMLLVAPNTEPWEGFERLPELPEDPGGMHFRPRCLHRRVAFGPS